MLAWSFSKSNVVAKENKIKSWHDNAVHKEVEKTNQETITVCWVISEKNETCSESTACYSTIGKINWWPL